MEKINFMVWVRCFTFNQAPYIVETMNGICMQQTSFPYVCTIADDASTDGEPEVIRQYVEQYFDLDDTATVRREETDDYHLLFARHKENRNCYFAVYFLKYNHFSNKKSPMQHFGEWDGIKYDALCDGDDYWISPEKLQRQVTFLENNPDYALVYSPAKVLENGGMNGTIGFRTCDFESIIKRNGIPTLTTMFRHELYKRYKKQFASMTSNIWIKGSDYTIWLYLSLHGKVQFVDEPLAVYRKLAGSASHSTDEKKSLLYADNICRIRHLYISYAEQLSGTENTSLRKQVAIENVKRVLGAYYSFNDFAGAKKYLKENRENLSFFSLLIMKLKVMKERFR